jgi:signal transduction histidine kinase
MTEETSFEIIEDSDTEKSKLKELEEKLKDTEKQLNELNRSLEQKVIERTIQIRKLLQHKIRFIDNLSHDLATPITPLITLLPLLKEKIEDPKSKEIVDTCIRNVEYIKRVINTTRELADVSAADLMLKKENLSKIVDEIIKKYEVAFKSNSIQPINKISKDVEIKTEKGRFLQILDQISSNAVNSMPEGGKITFSSKKVKRDSGEFIQVSIADTGVGLTNDQVNRLFDEFYKTDDARHKLDSTGLGLAICRILIEKHGGKIWADSHGPGKGTSIHFTIPSKEFAFDRSF